jgi:hypothetical protein
MVYFARIDVGQFKGIDLSERTISLIKIGMTTNLPSRLCWLRWHFKYPITILATIPGGVEEESRIHDRFSHLKIQPFSPKTRKREWFYPTAELMDFIKNLSASS